jgi:metal transporter CNNM
LNVSPELIGEEIYDEFDQQGAHLEMSSYIAPDPVNTNHVNETPTDSAAVGSAKLRITSTAQKGLSFLRSKSAPPIPDVVSSAEYHVGAEGSKSAGGTPTTSSAAPAIGNHSAESQDEPQTPSTAVGSDTMTILAPSPVLPHSDVPVIAPTTLHHPTLAEGIFKSIPFGVASAVPAMSRSASPAPSLEAILLDRKRRLNAGNAATVAGTSSSGAGGNLLAAPLTLPGAASSRNPSIKGKFKSRALRGGESAGIVIAEQVKGGLPGDGTGGLAAKVASEGAVSKSDDDAGTERILSPKDKEGPDKELV